MAAAFALVFAGAAQAQGVPAPPGTIRVDSARFTFVALPQDVPLARNLLREAALRDTFPGLPRPQRRATVLIAPDQRTFRDWIGAGAPEWGAAIAILDLDQVVMQGRNAPSSAGDPGVTLRHELAHLALHETMAGLPPRWFDEGYASFAAGEFGRDEVLTTNLALLVRGVPPLDSLDELFAAGETKAQQGYALAHRAVADLAALDPKRGLALVFTNWRELGSLDRAVRQAYGVTLGGFQESWRKSTRRRYGGLALFADATLAALVLLVIVAPLWLSRRRRDRAKLAAMRAADELAERRERESALEMLLGNAEQTPRNEDQIK